MSKEHTNISSRHLIVDGLNLEEPLASSADLMHDVAKVLCSGDHVDHSECSWYHGSWQYLRLLDLVSTPTWHDAFYRSSFNRCFEHNSQAKVLISGTADYSLFAYAVDTAIRSGTQPRITVLDQCATPLFACQWYAKQRAFPLNIVQANIIDFADQSRTEFDVIASDAFLTRFDADTVKKVIAGWGGMLRNNDSRIITTIRLHSPAMIIRDEERAVQEFISRACARLPRWRSHIRKPQSEITALAETYIRRMVSNKHGEQGDLVRLLDKGGLRCLHEEVGNVTGELHPTSYLRLMVGKKYAKTTSPAP